jgi:hypothetical protein
VCEIDFRLGGAWRLSIATPPPSRVVFSEIFEQFPDTAC